MPSKESDPGSHLQHLCNMELENRQGIARAIPDRGRLGEYLGSGEGAVFGQAINGIVHWDLFQEPGEFVCGSNLRGIIKVDDGSLITFDALGHLMRPDIAKPTEWVMTASIYFETDAQHYSWLNNVLAVLQGGFDMGAFRHSYVVYSQVSDKTANR